MAIRKEPSSSVMVTRKPKKVKPDMAALKVDTGYKDMNGRAIFVTNKVRHYSGVEYSVMPEKDGKFLLIDRNGKKIELTSGVDFTNMTFNWG